MSILNVEGGTLTTKADTTEEITHAQRERVYAEGEKAFEEGIWRVNNPYAANVNQMYCQFRTPSAEVKKSTTHPLSIPPKNAPIPLVMSMNKP